MRAKTYQALNFKIDNIELIDEIHEFANISFKVLDTSHDAADSMGLIINDGQKKLVHITDTGYLQHSILEQIANAHTYLLESNYDYDILIESEKYPFMTKKRIMSDHGHLSNSQCNEYLQTIIGVKTKNLLFAHLSPNNNEPEIVSELNQDLGLNQIVLKKEETVTCRLGVE